MTDEHRPAAGWDSDFYEFRQTPPARIREKLEAFITDASPEQIRAWRDSIPPLQSEVAEVLERSEEASGYSAILEYELPMDSRRPDAVFLAGAGVLVVELKGKLHAEQADIDQASAYARDLRCYHRECHSRPVIPILVPTRARGSLGLRDPRRPPQNPPPVAGSNSPTGRGRDEGAGMLRGRWALRHSRRRLLQPPALALKLQQVSVMQQAVE